MTERNMIKKSIADNLDSEFVVDDQLEKSREGFAKPDASTPIKAEGVDKISSATAKTSPKQGCSPKSTPEKTENILVVDDDEEQKDVNFEDDDNFDEEDDNFDEEGDSFDEEGDSFDEEGDSFEEESDSFDEEDGSSYDGFDVEVEDSNDEEIPEELNQGPDDKPATKFTSGAFVVRKTDMALEDNPSVWKICDKGLLRKYMPLEKDGKILYKNTRVYTGWSSTVKDKYYDAPVLFVQQTKEEHIIEFLKSEVKNDPKSEVAEGDIIESEIETK